MSEPSGRRSVPLKAALALAAVGLAGGALAMLVFLSPPESDARPKPPRPPVVSVSAAPTAGPSLAPTRPPGPPPGFMGTPIPRPIASAPTVARPTGVPAAPRPRPPNPLETRFPRTPEGTLALSSAFAAETNPRARVDLLFEFGRRVGAQRPADERGDVALAPDAIADFFKRALVDSDAGVRLQAIGVLSVPDFAPSGPLLESFVAQTSDQNARRVAIGGLAVAEGEAAVPLLTTLAGQGDSADRIAALEGLGHVASGPALAALDQVAASDAPAAVKDRAKGIAQRARNAPPPK